MNRRWADGPPAVFEILASGPALRRLAVAGEIDILTAPDLARFLRHHLDDVMPGTTVAVDLSRVTLLSAVGIGVLVQVAGDARQKGRPNGRRPDLAPRAKNAGAHRRTPGAESLTSSSTLRDPRSRTCRHLAAMQWFGAQYVTGPADVTDPRLALDPLGGLPPTLAVTAEYDTLVHAERWAADRTM